MEPDRFSCISDHFKSNFVHCLVDLRYSKSTAMQHTVPNVAVLTNIVIYLLKDINEGINQWGNLCLCCLSQEPITRVLCVHHMLSCTVQFSVCYKETSECQGRNANSQTWIWSIACTAQKYGLHPIREAETVSYVFLPATHTRLKTIVSTIQFSMTNDSIMSIKCTSRCILLNGQW